jgi:uncharacterized integral membrane protein (TIGR00697 family)
MFKIQKFDLLLSLYIFCIIVSELLGVKTFPLIKLGDYQLNSSVAILVFPIIFSINDVIVEVFGKERARSVVRSGILMIALLFILSILATWLPASTRFAGTEEAYDMIFQSSARIAFASLVGITIAEFMDIFIFVRIRQVLGKKALWFRNNVSNFAAQLIDTTIFMTLAFYALNKPLNENMVFLISLILPYWLLKCVMSVVETPFVYLGVKWLKEGEKTK